MKRPYDQSLKPSHIEHNRKTTQSRIDNNLSCTCTIKGCTNNIHRFGKVCYQHIKHKLIHGTYSPTAFKFRNNCTADARFIYKDNFTSDTLEELILLLDKLFKNPYAFRLEVLKGAYINSISSSKEKLANYIKDNKPPTFDNRMLGIRLATIYKRLKDGDITGGSQLRFNLAKALLPSVSSSNTTSTNTKEALGNIVHINFYTYLTTIADELSEAYYFSRVGY